MKLKKLTSAYSPVLSTLALGSIALSLISCSTSGGPPSPDGYQFRRPSLVSEVVAGEHGLQRLNEVIVAPVVAGPLIDHDRKGQLNQALVQAINAHTDLRVLNVEEPERVAQALAPLRGQAISGIEFAQKLGTASSAQGVILCEINRFVEREGSKFGANVSAAVGFKIRLIDARTGKTVWSAAYDRDDAPVTSNLLRLPEEMHEGVAFQSALGLTRNGFLEAAKSLGNARNSTGTR